MVKKGKYKLLSYLIEDHLIYYKSLNKNKKIIAFAILQYLNFKSIETFINDFLMKRMIQYYTIQIDTTEKDKRVLILSFEEYMKEDIIKAFNLIKKKVESQIKANFLKKSILEIKFLSLLSQSINSNTSISKNADSITISADKNSKVLNFYTINLNLIEKKESFILNFLNLITSLSKKGFLLFNFKIDSGEIIKFSPYFVLECEKIEKSFNIEDNINNFFSCNLVKRYNIEIQKIFKYLWRLEIIDNFFSLNDNYELFNTKEFVYSSDLIKINKMFEKNLIQNQIDYIRLNKDLLFIEQSNIFLILENLNSSYIHRIIEKYYPKYFIYILILNEEGYKELRGIETLKLIENLKIVDPKKFKIFNYKEFKRKLC